MEDINKGILDEIVKRLDQRISDLEKNLNEKNDRITDSIKHVKETLSLTQNSAKEAITKADKATDDHFKGHNEFNQRMEKVVSERASTDWAKAFESSTKEWQESFAKNTADKFAILERANSEKTGVKNFIGYALAIAVAAITIIMFIVNIKLK